MDEENIHVHDFFEFLLFQSQGKYFELRECAVGCRRVVVPTLASRRAFLQ